MSERSKEYARARGSGVGLAFDVGVEVQDLAAAAARENENLEDPDFAWLHSEFERVFGRRPVALEPGRAADLAAEVARVGRDRVAVLIDERAELLRRQGRDVRSLAYFAVPLAELPSRSVAPPLRVVETCPECELGGGHHAAGCSRAPTPTVDHSSAVARAAISEARNGAAA